MGNNYSVSFVVPLFKSEKTIATVVEKIGECNFQQWQAILVNDSSPDNVEASVMELIKRYPKNITYIRLSKNGGQHKAILTGLGHVRHPYVATIDDDGQNAPDDILSLIERLKDEDLDLVYGAFKVKKQTFFRKLASDINKKISYFTIGNKKGIPISNVRVFTKGLATALSKSSGNYSYIDGLIFKLTDRIGYSYINQYDRFEGRSSYTLTKLLKLWWNHMIGYSNLILHLLSIFSFFMSICAFLLGIIYFILTINNEDRPAGWLSIYLTSTLLFSFLFLFLSIIGEYIGRLYMMNTTATKKLVSKRYDDRE